MTSTSEPRKHVVSRSKGYLRVKGPKDPRLKVMPKASRIRIRMVRGPFLHAIPSGLGGRTSMKPHITIFLMIVSSSTVKISRIGTATGAMLDVTTFTELVETI